MTREQLAKDIRAIIARVAELQTEAAASQAMLELCPDHMHVVDQIFTESIINFNGFADAIERKKPCGHANIAQPTTDFISMLESIFGPGTVIQVDESTFGPEFGGEGEKGN